MSTGSDLTHDDVLRILKIVDEAADVEVRLELDGFKLHVQKFGNAAAIPRSVTTEPASDTARRSEPEAPSPAPQAPAPSPEPATESPAAPEQSAAAEPELEPGTEFVRSPMMGRFFRSPSPMESPYVEVGAEVGADDPVCLLEVMKVFNTVRAGTQGMITRILVEDDTMVEQGQPLFIIKTT